MQRCSSRSTMSWRILYDPAAAPAVRSLLDTPLHRRGRRQGVMLTDQPHINTAKHFGYAQKASSSDRNCALCSTAGAINLLQGRTLWTTGMIAEAVGSSDSKEGMGSGSAEQAVQIKNVVAALAGARIIGEIGSPDVGNTLSVSSAASWMGQQPAGTVFVLLASGSGIGHHWLNAVVTGATIDFIDYQTDKKQMGSWNLGTVSHGDKPFHGVSGGEYGPTATAYVIAFAR